MVHTRDLRYFLAVAEHAHVTRAAASLFVTQPALSKQVASLERTLGAQLFVRRHDGMALTAAGEALVPLARQMVDLDERVLVEVRQAATSAEKLVIGFWLAPAADVLSAAVSAFSARHPSAKLRLRRADWAEGGAGVLSGHADVAFVATPHDCPVPGLRSHRLAVEELVLAVPVGHPLLDRGVVTLEDLASQTQFVLPREAGQLGHRRFAPPGSAAGAAVEFVTTIDETIENIATGLGVCVLTPSVLAAHPHPRVRSVPLRVDDRGDYCVVWRARDEQRPSVRDLVQELVSAHGRWMLTVSRAPGGPGDVHNHQ